MASGGPEASAAGGLADGSRVRRRHIAVVGSGIAGLTAAYVLQRTADVTLYEADSRLGGHSHTHDVVDGGAAIHPGDRTLSSRGATGPTLAIDTGFIVHNARTYPTLLRLFAELGVQTQPSEMSMSVRAGCGLEYAGARGVAGLFPTRSLARPGYLRMLTEVPRFHRAARRLLAASEQQAPEGDQTLRDFLAQGRFTPYFVPHFMEPLVAAVWSCDRPWRALPGALPLQVPRTPRHASTSPAPRSGAPSSAARASTSRKLARAVSGLHGDAGTGACAVSPAAASQTRRRQRTPRRYDAVVVATHPDQALAMLAEPTAAQREVLGAIRYSDNHALLHTDRAAPAAPRAPGVVELPCAARAGGSSHGHLRPDPAAAAADTDATTSSRSAARTSSTRARSSRDGVRAPALHPRVGRRAAPAAGGEHRASRSPAPTTAGASTRTAPARALAAAEPRRVLDRGTPRLSAARPASRHGSRDPRTLRCTTSTIQHPRTPRSATSSAPQLPLAGRPRRPARPRPARPASRRATTSARPMPRSGPTSTRSWPRTASTCAAAGC